MELEAKLTLSSLDDLEKVSQSLSASDPNHKTEQDTDLFIDGVNSELERGGTVLRIRASNQAGKEPTFKATLKELSDVSDGSSMRWEHHDTITAAQAAAFKAEPNTFLSATLPISQTIREKFGLKRLHSLGEISTIRKTFTWASCASQPGLTIRLDKTTFPFGDRYELEVPHITVPVHDVLDELQKVLGSLGATATMGTETKFQQLRSGEKAALAKAHMIMEAKLALVGEDDYQKVHTSLGGSLLETQHHDNLFFDGAEGELHKRQTYFRVRLDHAKGTCVATIKENTGVTDGSSLCWAQEEAIPLNVGVNMKAEPNSFWDGIADSKLAVTLKVKYGITSLVFAGSFSTVRQIHAWPNCVSQPGLTIRLDNTTYPFGSRYEMEVPAIRVPVEDVVHELGGVLQGLGANFTQANLTKFEQFEHGCKQAFMNPQNC